MSKILIKNQHRYTKEKNVIYNGDANINRYNDYIEIIYNTNEEKVTIYAYEEKFVINRKTDELSSTLTFIKDQETENKFSSEFGEFMIPIHTCEYASDDSDLIKIEYDILSGDDPDGYEITFEIKEDINEFN